MNICFLGTYIKSSSRNKMLMDGLRLYGYTIIEVNVANPQTKLDHRNHLTLVKIFRRILHKFLLLPTILTHLPSIRKADVIVVGFPGHLDIPIAYIVAKIFGKKLIFDPTVSLYSMIVEDFLLLKSRTILARFILFAEKLLYKLPNAIIADTPLQKQYYHTLLGVALKKIFVLPLGADASIYSFSGFKKRTPEFIVVYYGMYNPLHGVEYIIKAAELLKEDRDIRFLFIGDGQTYPESVALTQKLHLNNITFFKDMREADALATLQTADIFLGFMQNLKTVHRQLPNKVFQGMALGKVVLTADTLAIRSVFNHEENIYLVPPCDPHELANAIRRLKNDENLSHLIAKNGYNLYLARFTPKAIGKHFAELLQKVL